MGQETLFDSQPYQEDQQGDHLDQPQTFEDVLAHADQLYEEGEVEAAHRFLDEHTNL